LELYIILFFLSFIRVFPNRKYIETTEEIQYIVFHLVLSMFTEGSGLYSPNVFPFLVPRV